VTIVGGTEMLQT